jgi:acetylornithine aminotransferase
VSAAGIATLRALEEEKLLENAATVGGYLKAELGKALQGSPGVREVRGQGLMIGIELEKPCAVLTMRALEAGLLINVTRDRVVRLLPPLTLNTAEADEIVKILVPLIKTFNAESA